MMKKHLNSWLGLGMAGMLCALLCRHGGDNEAMAACNAPPEYELVAWIDGSSLVCVNQDETFSVFANGPIDSYAWAAEGGTPASGEDYEFTTKWSSPGYNNVSVSIVGADRDENHDCKAEDEMEVTVVAVDRIDYDGKSGASPTLVPVGSTVTFTAIPTPGNLWPDGKPAWAGVDSSSGATATKNFDAPGDYTITAECGNTVTEKVTAVKVDLAAVAAGYTPELTDGRICINAQTEYKKAKWTAIVKPSGTATVTPVSGGVTVIGGAGLADGDTFWVEAGNTVGDYQIKITHDSLASCTAIVGEKIFKFMKEETYSPKNVREDFVMKGTNIYLTPNYYSGKLKNVNTCTDSSVYFENITHEWLMFDLQNAEFTVEISGAFGVITEPTGLYSGEVKAKFSCTWSGSINASEFSTASYHMRFKVDGVACDHPCIDELMPPGGGVPISLNKTEFKDGVQFTVGAKDGVITSGSHGCAQKTVLQTDQDAMVDGSHTIDLTNFQIVQ